MLQKVIKVLSAIFGFAAGFLLFGLVGLNLESNIKMIILIVLLFCIILALIGIIIYYKIKNKDRLFVEVSDDAREHHIKKKLASNGADKSLVEVKSSDDEIKIIEINKGFNAVLLVKRDSIIMYYEVTSDYNKLDKLRQEYVDNLLDKRFSDKSLAKLTSDELYKEFQDFVNRTI